MLELIAPAVDRHLDVAILEVLRRFWYLRLPAFFFMSLPAGVHHARDFSRLSGNNDNVYIEARNDGKSAKSSLSTFFQFFPHTIGGLCCLSLLAGVDSSMIGTRKRKNILYVATFCYFCVSTLVSLLSFA